MNNPHKLTWREVPGVTLMECAYLLGSFFGLIAAAWKIAFSRVRILCRVYRFREYGPFLEVTKQVASLGNK